MSREIRPELYIDDTWLTKILKWSISLVILCSIGMFLIHAVQLVALGAVRSDPDAEMFAYQQLLQLSEVAELVVVLPFVLAVIVSTVLFLKWFGRTNHNLSKAMGEPLEFSPSGCIWAFILPIVNLWWPVRAMTEVIRTGDGSSEEDKSALERLATRWWFVFWLSSVIGRVATRMMQHAKTSDDYYFATMATVISDGFDIAERMLALWVVGGISRTVRAKAEAEGVVDAPEHPLD